MIAWNRKTAWVNTSTVWDNRIEVDSQSTTCLSHSFMQRLGIGFTLFCIIFGDISSSLRRTRHKGIFTINVPPICSIPSRQHTPILLQSHILNPVLVLMFRICHLRICSWIDLLAGVCFSPGVYDLHVKVGTGRAKHTQTCYFPYSSVDYTSGFPVRTLLHTIKLRDCIYPMFLYLYRPFQNSE